jgi:hypothetical protein
MFRVREHSEDGLNCPERLESVIVLAMALYFLTFFLNYGIIIIEIGIGVENK